MILMNNQMIIISTIILIIAILVSIYLTKKIIDGERQSTVAAAIATEQVTIGANLNFENDIIFINNLIDEYLKNEAMLMAIKKIDFMNTKEILTFAGETSIIIFSKVSERYKSKMSLYFSEIGFYDYINERVSMSVVNISYSIMSQNRR